VSLNEVRLDQLEAYKEEFLKRHRDVAAEFAGDTDMLDKVFPDIDLEDDDEIDKANNFIAKELMVALLLENERERLARYGE
jgi:hypothetical protein